MQEKQNKISIIKCSNVDCENPWLPHTEEHFYGQWFTNANGNKVFKLNKQCKECRKKKSRKRILDNHDEYLQYLKEWNRENKIKRKPVRREWRDKTLEERMEYQREWQENNPDKIQGYNTKYSEKKHKISKNEWDECRIYFNFRCAYCGKTWEQNNKETKKDLHREHVDNNGSDKLDNCVPSCRDCNSAKYDFTFTEWYNENNPIFSEERKEMILKWLNEDHKKYINV